MEKKKVQRSKMQDGSFPYDHFFDIISGKWKSAIMVSIFYDGCIHFNAFQKLWNISSKVLYTQLADLEKDGLIERQEITEGEKKSTKYVMTKKGFSIMSILKEIYLWAMKDMKDKDIKIDPRSYEYNTNKKRHVPENISDKNFSDD